MSIGDGTFDAMQLDDDRMDIDHAVYAAFVTVH
jgi:hypothetical protein